jgi:lipoprotein-releasing system ATP-binding protein
MGDYLKVESVSKSFPYGDSVIEILRDVSFILREGDLATLVGDSGTGKSTLMHIIGGMESPDKGRVLIENVSFYELSGNEKARFRNEKIGFVFQFHHLLPEFTALENIVMPLLIRGLPLSAVRKRGEKLLAEIGLDHRQLNRPGELSGGEQQRLAIGRALISEPTLLLLDEPTGNLDPGTGSRVLELVEMLLQRYSMTALLVTHNHDIAQKGNRRFRMTEGNISEEKPARPGSQP